ncbi:hypothetical protein TNCV_3897991 [Trichonephila clavipes]|nr:hypothetical protein TNCV_3897991 [Trichonephila clavipes]
MDVPDPLKRLRDAIRPERPEKEASNNFLYNNAPPYRAVSLNKIPCQKQYYHSGIPSLFSQPSTNEFLPGSTAKSKMEGTSFCGFRLNDPKCDDATEKPLKYEF